MRALHPTLFSLPSLFVVLVAGLPMAGSRVAAAQPAAPPESSWKPGEVIVRFAPASSLAAATGKALEGRLQEEPALVEAVGTLSRQLAIPFTARQVTSGGEVVLEIDRGALRGGLAEKLRQDPRVAAATPVESEAESPFRDPRIEVTATLVPSGNVTNILAAAAQTAERGSADLDALAASLAGDFGLPFRTRARGGLEITFDLDLRQLTQLLAEQLRAQPGVESVELNRLLGIR